jgi:bile acid:Na+ symporter, BASS family
MTPEAAIAASQFINRNLIPIVLALIFFSAGLALTIDDFKRVFTYPKAVTLGVLGQLILVPIVGFIVAKLFLGGNPALAAGLMIVLVCVGGSNSTLINMWLGGHVPLSVTLSAIMNLITIVTIPILANFALQQFLGSTTAPQFNVPMVIMELLLVIALPTIIGMVIRARAPELGRKLERPVKILGTVAFAIAILVAAVLQAPILARGAAQVGIPVLVANIVLMLIGYGIGAAARLPYSQKLCLGIEMGIQNGAVAIYLSQRPPFITDYPDMFISALIYAVFMLFTGLAFAFIMNRVAGNSAVEAAPSAV